jgi:hypothetical protein
MKSLLCKKLKKENARTIGNGARFGKNECFQYHTVVDGYDRIHA